MKTSVIHSLSRLVPLVLISLTAGCPKETPPAADASPDVTPSVDGSPADAGADAGEDVMATDLVGGLEVPGEADSGVDLASGGADGAVSPAFKVLTGALPLYHVPKNIMNAKPRNDASGVVFLAATKQVLVIDDGGEDASPDVVPLYLTSVASLFGPPPILMTEVPGPAELATSLPAKHRDLEGMTSSGGFVYLMSSLPAVSEKADPFNRSFSRFKLTGGQLSEGATIDPRDAIFAALTVPTADPWFASWLERWKDQKAKDGGFQVESLSTTADGGKLLVGLRSPHYSADYLTPRIDDPTKKSTRVGAAMLVEIDVAAFDASKLAARVFATVDLGGLGFRGMEYSPTAGGHFITAGAVEAGFDYKFLFWNGTPGTAAIDLSERIPEWKKLCRPESVSEVQHDGRNYLLVLSEESGAICEQPAAPYNYLLIELDETFRALLH